jgi:23S rRNA (guanine2445-N2)-methyltransferase / 23S rRNA (guanine2069-N7)-methyltransferase
VAGSVAIETRDLSEFAPPTGANPGLVVTNPPHGIRMGDAEALRESYALLGERLRERFGGWRAAVFTPEPELARAVGMRSHKQYSLFNGPTPTKLYLFDVY